MDELNDIQKEMVAGLTANPAFALLLKTMEGSIQSMQDDLEFCLDEKKEGAILNKWRAMRWAHRELSTTPERFSEELEDYFEQRKKVAGGLLFPDVRTLSTMTPTTFPFAQYPLPYELDEEDD